MVSERDGSLPLPVVPATGSHVAFQGSASALTVRLDHRKQAGSHQDSGSLPARTGTLRMYVTPGSAPVRRLPSGNVVLSHSNCRTPVGDQHGGYPGDETVFEPEALVAVLANRQCGRTGYLQPRER